MTQLVNTTVAPAPIPSEQDELWYTRCAIATNFGVTVERGAFDEEFPESGGLQWRSIQASDDPQTRLSHFTHRKERSFRHGGNVPSLWARSEGADTRLIGLTWLPTPDVILALPESGIEDASDLRGKRLLVLESPESVIDVWQATTLHTYEAALRSVGLTFDDVSLVRVRQPQTQIRQVEPVGDRTLAALRAKHKTHREALLPLVRGEVDAVIGHAHFAIELAAIVGANVVFDQRTLPDPLDRVNLDVPDTLTVSGELLERDPEHVARVVVRLLETYQWAQGHPDEAWRLLAREIDATEEVLRVAHGEDLIPGFDFNFDEQSVAGLERQKDFLLRHGFITHDFDVRAWIDPAPLERARELLQERAVARD